MNKHNKKPNTKIGLFLLFISSLVGCSPSLNRVSDDPENSFDMGNQVSFSADFATTQPVDFGQAPRTNCVSPAPKLNAECCLVWCNDQTVNIQLGKWRMDDYGEFKCDYGPNKTSYDCSSTQLRCDDRKGGCVR